MPRLRAAAPFLLLATLWGFSFPAISIGLGALPPVLFAAFRYDIAAILLLGHAAIRTERWRPTTGPNLRAVVAAGVFLVAGNAFLFIGQQTVPSGVAAILQSLVPIATTLWGLALLSEERIGLLGVIGVLLGLGGVALVVRPDPANLFAGDTIGRLLILLQVSSVSLGGVLIQRSKPSLKQTALAGWSMGIGAMILHAASIAAGETFRIGIPTDAAVAVVYLGVFATGVAFFLYFTLLDRHGAFETSLVAYVVPLVAAVAGAILLGEEIAVLSLIGFVVVFLGFAVLKRESIREYLSEHKSPV